jgi:signal transduction histidine kinase
MRDDHLAGGPDERLEASIRGVGTHDHICLIYETREEQQRSILPFLRQGVAQHERCFYVADSRTVAATNDVLRAGGIPVDEGMRSGAFALATERETYLAGGVFDPDVFLAYASAAARQAAADGYSALRIAGEMTWALGGDPGSDRVIEYEAKVNVALPDVPALALCQYDRRRFSAEVIRDVIRTHPLVIVGGRVCRNFYYVPPGELVGPDRHAHDVERLLANLLERERAEDAVREGERRLERANRLASIGTLAAGVAHEMRNPLGYVSSNLTFVDERLREAAASGAIPPGVAAELGQAICDAREGADRVIEIVKGLRGFAGPASGGARGPVDVRAEILAASTMARAQVRARARFVLELPEALPPVVAGAHEVGQVVLNLLVNAAQAVAPGHPADNEVRIAARSDGPRLVIDVSDTGAGIPADVLPRVFDPFFTTKADGEGTGLGLSICHGIVAAAGGTIEVESRPGRGTRFRVTLPASGEGGVTGRS